MELLIHFIPLIKNFVDIQLYVLELFDTTCDYGLLSLHKDDHSINFWQIIYTNDT